MRVSYACYRAVYSLERFPATLATCFETSDFEKPKDYGLMMGKGWSPLIGETWRSGKQSLPGTSLSQPAALCTACIAPISLGFAEWPNLA